MRSIDRILREARAFLETETSLNRVELFIDKASKAISNSMIGGIQKLAALVDVDFNTVLAFVFKPKKSELSDRIVPVSKEANGIYNRGEYALNYFQQVHDNLQKK